MTHIEAQQNLIIQGLIPRVMDTLDIQIKINHSDERQLTFRFRSLMACPFDEISSFNPAMVSFSSSYFCFSRFFFLDHAPISKCLAISLKF
jgi:hypothetical protein